MTYRMCSTCLCCGSKRGQCDGGKEHDERVLRLSKLPDEELLTEVLICEIPTKYYEAWCLLHDIRQSREVRSAR